MFPEPTKTAIFKTITKWIFSRIMIGDDHTMRLAREPHLSLFSQYTEHPFSEDLARLSSLFDAHPEVSEWVLADLANGTDERGAKGTSAEEVLRAALLKQIRQWSYRELE